ncbi:MAG: hybrid sensor histidine kinase/response regulator [Candidatus Parabeggiatoa sp. nov. 2]|nr:MAG: hybrid sensor histidine kinase/response regulator [Beggiatoa sp. 4572_84]RKZ58645.1 MAG: hybrid sensor histidine kinase/response regulator [Gammaproteobacteria bacterium]
MNETNLQPETILIVDDIPANVSFLLEFLSHAGFKVLVAKEGKAALKKAEYAHPDLILLDVMMPGFSGFEVCKALKSNENTKDIPIIFMTALSDTVDKVKGFSLGAVDYITKPIQHEEVLARVTTHLKLRKLQQQLEEELQVRKEYAVKLEKRNTELNAFARTVAHDLKNPLTGVMGLSERLLEMCSSDTLPTDNARTYLQLIAQSGQKMVDIINALLLLARASEQDKVKTQPLSMSRIITQVIEKRLFYMIRDFQGKIHLPETWPIALGYAPWVEEIWANYLSNGLKYGGQPPHLALGADTQNDGMIRFWVRDNGPGLSIEAQAKLFTPFMRLHKHRADGHGLGLSIVQQVVEKLRGQVGVESSEGLGSVFYFTLPAPTN